MCIRDRLDNAATPYQLDVEYDYANNLFIFCADLLLGTELASPQMVLFENSQAKAATFTDFI